MRLADPYLLLLLLALPALLFLRAASGARTRGVPSPTSRCSRACGRHGACASAGCRRCCAPARWRCWWSRWRGRRRGRPRACCRARASTSRWCSIPRAACRARTGQGDAAWPCAEGDPGLHQGPQGRPRRPGDLSRESLVLSPMTLDYQALDDLVGGVNEVNLPDGTAIGVGVGGRLNLLRDSKARSRVAIVLLTDGENNTGNIEPLAAARLAQTLGIRLYTIGVIDHANAPGGSERRREGADGDGERHRRASTSPPTASRRWRGVQEHRQAGEVARRPAPVRAPITSSPCTCWRGAGRWWHRVGADARRCGGRRLMHARRIASHPGCF